MSSCGSGETPACPPNRHFRCSSVHLPCSLGLQHRQHASDRLCPFPPFWSDPYEDHSGSLRLITIKPTTAQPTYSYPSSSSHSQDSVVVNGDVSQQQHHRTEQCDRSGLSNNCKQDNNHVVGVIPLTKLTLFITSQFTYNFYCRVQNKWLLFLDFPYFNLKLFQT